MCDCLTLRMNSLKEIKPAILLAVAYQYRRRGDSGSEATGTMHSAERQAQTARGELNCQHQAVWRLGLGNMVNVSELLINVVTVEKLKMLISFTKRYVEKLSCCKLMICRYNSTGEKAEPKLSDVTRTEHSKPVLLLERGKDIARYLKETQVKDGRESECHVVMMWIKVAALPCMKMSRLLPGLWLRDNWKNLCKEESK